MDIKNLSLLLIVVGIISCLFGCDKCEGDEFGAYMKLIVPINTTPSQDTFTVGDTLWIEANIDKFVTVENESEKIFLEGFNFFTELIISEISDTVENFVPEIEIIERIGQVENLDLPTVFVHPLFYVEDEFFYRISIGIIFQQVGRYYVAFDSEPELYEYYEHPAVYLCEDTRRQSIEVSYVNSSTNENAFNNIYLDTDVGYLIELVDYPRFESGGGHTFIVRE